MANPNLKAMLDALSPEEKAERLRRAKAKQVENAEQRKANEHLLKLDYADMNYWLDLASKYKFVCHITMNRVL